MLCNRVERGFAVEDKLALFAKSLPCFASPALNRENSCMSERDFGLRGSCGGLLGSFADVTVCLSGDTLLG